MRCRHACGTVRRASRVAERIAAAAWAAFATAGCRFAFEDRPDAALVWSAPAPIPGASSPTLSEENGTMSSTGTELVFTIQVGPTSTDLDFYVMTRATPVAPWSDPLPLVELNSPMRENGPRFDPSDLVIYFASARPGGLGSEDVWMSTRIAIGQPWSAPQHVAEVSSTMNDKWLSPCEGGHYVMVRNSELLQGTIGAGPPQLIAELDAAGYNSGTFLSLDCRTLMFGSARGGNIDLYRAERADASTPWSTPIPMAEINTPDGEEEDPWQSPDERIFMYSTTATGIRDLYITSR